MRGLSFIAQPWFLQMAAIFGLIIIVGTVAVWLAACIAERRWPRIITVRERRRS